jgi:hypothetical protein
VYRLECDGERLTIRVDARYRQFLLDFYNGKHFPQEVAELAKNHGLKAFRGSPEVSGPWGFGGAIRLVGEPDADWLEFSAEIPRVEFKGVYEWEQAFHVCHSFQTLLEALWYVPAQSEGAGRQSLLVKFFTHESMHGGSLFAEVSPALVTWLVESFTEPLQADVDDCMERVYRRMVPGWNHHIGARCHISHETLQLDSGSNGSLGVIGCRKADEGRGYDISPHNCDTPLDQLVLFAALCRIDQLFHQTR